MLEEGPYEEEYRVIRPDGSMRWVEGRAFPLRDENGRAYRVTTIVQDISTRKQQEEALRKSEALHSQLEKMGKLGHWEWDYINDRMVSCSEQLAQIFEMSVDETVKYFSCIKAMASFIPPEDQEGFEQSYRQSIKQQNGQYIEQRLISQSGAVRYVYSVSERVFNDQGELISGIGIMHDITERVEAEAALKESETRFQQIANAIDDVFKISDAKSLGVLFVSPAFEKIWGRSVQELYDDYRVWDDGLHLDDVKDMQEAWGRTLKGEDTYEKEYRVIHSDGSMRWIRSRAYPIRDQNGQIFRVAGISQDITERVEADEALRELNSTLEQRVSERTAQLEASNKELEDFSYSVSHDLRAPLRSIGGFAEIIGRRHRKGLSEEAQHYFDNIIEASSHMSQLIDDLLSYSRLGRRSVPYQPVPLSKVLARVTDNLDGHIVETQANLNIPKDLPIVSGNEILLGQIFANLIDNALTYHRPNLPPKIVLDYKAGPNHVIISVADEGIGIPFEYHDKIFNILQRLHSQDDYPGTGIGLAIVKKTVQLLGGRVWVKSAIGEGSIFYVELPIKENSTSVN